MMLYKVSFVNRGDVVCAGAHRSGFLFAPLVGEMVERLFSFKRFDSAYKLVFSHPEVVQDLVQHFLHEDWVKDIDFKSLEKVNGSFVSEDFRQRESDVIWRVRFEDRWLYLYVLLEFQSTVDHFMAVRLMTYMGLLYQDIIRNLKGKNQTSLPPILPWVIYTGQSKWSGPTSSDKLLNHATPKALQAYFPKFRYELLDIGRYPLKTAKKAGTNLVAPLIEFEQCVHDPKEALPIVRSLLARLKEPRFDGLRRTFATYARYVLKLEQEETPSAKLEDLQEVSTVLAERMEAYYKRLTQKGLEDGRKKGLEEGREEGREKGLEEGRHALVQTVITQLRQRFGKVSKDVVDWFKNASLEALQKVAKNILVVSSLDELLACVKDDAPKKAVVKTKKKLN